MSWHASSARAPVPGPSDDRPEFAGSVALITGGGSGIGLAAARTIAARGGRVVVADLAVGDVPRGITGVTTDVTDRCAVEAAVDKTVRLYGGVDILVNNAAIPAAGTVADNSDEEWARVLDVNVLGLVRASRAALPFLARSSAAAIVNTASVAATNGMPGLALYSASKGAIRALTMAMAADYVGCGIRVNCVSPGTVDSPWIMRRVDGAERPEALLSALEARQPTHRLVTMQEAAEAIVYLASPRSRSTTGTDLTVDGGLTRLRVPHAGIGDLGQISRADSVPDTVTPGHDPEPARPR